MCNILFFTQTYWSPERKPYTQIVSGAIQIKWLEKVETDFACSLEIFHCGNGKELREQSEVEKRSKELITVGLGWVLCMWERMVEDKSCEADWEPKDNIEHHLACVLPLVGRATCQDSVNLETCSQSSPLTWAVWRISARLDYMALYYELLFYPIPPIPHHPMKSRVSRAFVHMGCRAPGEYQQINRNNKLCWSLLSVLFFEWKTKTKKFFFFFV